MIKFNNFGTRCLNEPRRLFHSFCCNTWRIFEPLRVYEPGFNTHEYGMYVYMYVLDSNFNSSCIGKSQPNNMHISLNMKPSWLTWISTRQNTVLVNNFNEWCNQAHMHFPLVWHNKYKPYNSSIPLQWFLIFSFTSQKKGKQAWMKELTMVQYINLNWKNRCVLAYRYSVLWVKLALFSYY